jgi:hypothetical protein
MKNKVINLFGNNKIVPNMGVKYSELLEQFMNPFMSDFENYEYVEEIMEFAINAWNMANINIIMPNEDIQKAMQPNEAEDGGIKLLKKMMIYKEKKFKAYTNFIVDFKLKEVQTGKDPILSVVTQEEDAYLANMLNTIESGDQHSQENFDENYINRSAIILKPLQPFLDWLNNLYPDDKVDDIREINTYLVTDEIEDLETYLKNKFDTFFMMELNDWHINKKEWPQKRNYKMFNLWFCVETSQMIYDLEKKPIFKSE